jgi:hypothetical protein
MDSVFAYIYITNYHSRYVKIRPSIAMIVAIYGLKQSWLNTAAKIYLNVFSTDLYILCCILATS